MARSLKLVGPGQPAPRKPELLGDILRKLGPSSSERARGVNATLWRQAMGHKIADRTHPTRLFKKTLYVRVASASWAQELGLLSAEIVERLQANGLDVTSVRFEVGPLTSPLRVKHAKRVQRGSVPETLKARANRIADDALRDALLDAIAYWSRNTARAR